MRLIVKQAGRTINEYQFTKGPIYIGRQTNSQIFLPDRRISRHHAVVFCTKQGQWMVEDLDSANKTYLNDAIVHKSHIKTGDKLRIMDFIIEIDLEKDAEQSQQVGLADTIVGADRQPQVIVRKVHETDAAEIRLPAGRFGDFARATELICEADSLGEMVEALLGIAAGQLNAFNTFCALRSSPAGAMSAHSGRSRDGRILNLEAIKLRAKISQALDKGEFLLLPGLPDHRQQKIQSAIIAPIKGSAGCFGVLYTDNAIGDEPYSLADLDYAMLLAVHTATILKNF